VAASNGAENYELKVTTAVRLKIIWSMKHGEIDEGDYYIWIMPELITFTSLKLFTVQIRSAQEFKRGRTTHRSVIPTDDHRVEV
jgi:hypothetical protein